MRSMRDKFEAAADFSAQGAAPRPSDEAKEPVGANCVSAIVRHEGLSTLQKGAR
jgi:hypothetical protein